MCACDNKRKFSLDSVPNRIANKLISAMNEEAYQKKERLIERLSCLRLPDEDADWELR